MPSKNSELTNENLEINDSAKEKVNEVIHRLNNTHEKSGSRTSPIRSNNSSVLGKSKKPVDIK